MAFKLGTVRAELFVLGWIVGVQASLVAHENLHSVSQHHPQRPPPAPPQLAQ